MTDTPDIVAEIKSRVDPSRFDFTRAEGRRDFDNALRAELKKIRDNSLRAHAGEMLKHWRLDQFGQHAPMWEWQKPGVIARLEAIEAFLGLKPRPQQTEIKSLRARGQNGGSVISRECDMAKALQVGDLVKIREGAYLRGSAWRHRKGRIVGWSRDGEPRVLWDGLKTPELCNADHLRVLNEATDG